LVRKYVLCMIDRGHGKDWAHMGINPNNKHTLYARWIESLFKVIVLI
jgi:hypothetical protein